MNHLSEEQLVDAVYGDLALPLQQHLASCPQCSSEFRLLQRQLEMISDYPVPARSHSYGSDVWRRLQPRLPVKKSPLLWFRAWFLVPAFAASLFLAFYAGVWTQQRRGSSPPADSSERVFLLATSDHLQRSEIALTELLHTAPGSSNLPREQALARNLLAENRLLRQSAVRIGDSFHAALLDDLERVLLDLANGSEEPSPADLAALQQRIENDRLLWKLRITVANTRQQGQKL